MDLSLLIFSIVCGLNHLILATTRVWTHPLKVPYSKAHGRKSKSSKPDPPRSTPDSPPSAGDPPHDTELTPQKAAHLKSTYIQQIKELHSLQTVGAISNEDLVKQRDILLAQLSKM